MSSFTPRQALLSTLGALASLSNVQTIASLLLRSFMKCHGMSLLTSSITWAGLKLQNAGSQMYDA